MAADAHRRFDAAHAAGAMLVEHCDIPADMTIGQWRAVCAAERRAARTAQGGLRGTIRRVLRRR